MMQETTHYSPQIGDVYVLEGYAQKHEKLYARFRIITDDCSYLWYRQIRKVVFPIGQILEVVGTYKKRVLNLELDFPKLKPIK